MLRTAGNLVIFILNLTMLYICVIVYLHECGRHKVHLALCVCLFVFVLAYICLSMHTQPLALPVECGTLTMCSLELELPCYNSNYSRYTALLEGCCPQLTARQAARLYH